MMGADVFGLVNAVLSATDGAFKTKNLIHCPLFSLVVCVSVSGLAGGSLNHLPIYTPRWPRM